MIAKVSLGFKFIGGSSLGGPISQLQNAVSYNFFANTSVYNPAQVLTDAIATRNKFIYGAFKSPEDQNTKMGEITKSYDAMVNSKAEADSIKAGLEKKVKEEAETAKAIKEAEDRLKLEEAQKAMANIAPPTGGNSPATGAPTQEIKNGTIVFDTNGAATVTDINFKVEKGKPFPVQFYLTNRGTAPILITEISNDGCMIEGCGNFDSLFSKAPLLPNKVRTVKFTHHAETGFSEKSIKIKYGYNSAGLETSIKVKITPK
jgi:hypothetical protein